MPLEDLIDHIPRAATALLGLTFGHHKHINQRCVVVRYGKLLDSLGLPKKVSSFRRDGTEDMPTSPMRTIREVLDDPFFYLRHECEMQHGHGLNLLEFPEQLHGLCCYLPDDRVSGTQAHEERRRREEENLNLAYLLDDLESNLTHVQQHPKGA